MLILSWAYIYYITAIRQHRKNCYVTEISIFAISMAIYCKLRQWETRQNMIWILLKYEKEHNNVMNVRNKPINTRFTTVWILFKQFTVYYMYTIFPQEIVFIRMDYSWPRLHDFFLGDNYSSVWSWLYNKFFEQ